MGERDKLEERILQPYDFGSPVVVGRVYDYLREYEADTITWFEAVTVMAHVANVAMFSAQIAEACNKQVPGSVDVHKAWVMGWLRDIGRVPWGLAKKNGLTSITDKYGHHGYLGYTLLLNSGVPEELAIIAMTHIGSGVTREEMEGVREFFGRDVFPVRDWYAKTLEEQIVVIADKVPGWKNTVLAPYRKFEETGGTAGSIFGEYAGDQGPLWDRFWGFKRTVDKAAGMDVLELFDQGLLSSVPDAYARLPKPREISEMDY